jgi:hypothetical protein
MTDHDRKLDDLATRLARPLRDAERLPADFEARLMARVRAEARPGGAPGAARSADLGWRRAAQWAFETRPVAVSVSPARVLLAAGLLLAAVLGARAIGRDGAASLAAGDTAAPAQEATMVVPRDTVRLVQFVLVAPGARSVALVGDFNDWAPGATPLRAADGGGLWAVELPLQTGRYQYAFIVDGERWVVDPKAPRAVEESFGPPNSVITVGERSS